MHLTDGQLNEYLDEETTEYALFELHLASCDACAARLAALRDLFVEIESLPETELTQSIAERLVLDPMRTSSLPAWLTPAVIVQIFVAWIAVLLAAPFLSGLLPAVEIPSLTGIWLQLQSQWATWLGFVSAFQFPPMPRVPVPGIPNLILILILAGISLLWLMGNGLLLRKQGK